ncbi:peptidyl-prolyl cis-trans isomerase D [Luteimonas cucumeris]|uniref:Periplasmic chaperone PpiD n=1 Tax=Luteimonas cucumeris TaxID=985012 RepID=A0A562L7M3_9GAMM|nr:SurA N-terminal domain-containing protein [Luteimonas cucumeris]TWI03454.1 peptidyl-prolyl cis-trans isomerase D [Luteimonas cucumeris]
MLQNLRDKSSSWIAKVILALLLIPFAFFGVEQYLSQRVDNYAAKVSTPPTWWQSAPSWWPARMLWTHHEVSVDEFRTRFEQQRQQQRAEAGDAFDAKAFESVENKRTVLDKLIDEQVLRIAAERSGIVVSDAEVRDTIQSLPEFQVDGKFDVQRYQLGLASLIPPRTPLQFEQLVRDSLQQSQIPGRIADSSFVTSGELDRMLALLGEKRDVSFALLPAVADTGAISGEEIQKWYRDHASEYRAPESVSIEYVELNAATLQMMPADDAELRRRYDQEKARFVAAEQRQAAHILVRVDANADAAAQKTAEQKATQLAAQAKQPGADFAALARANSDDPGSKDAGGDLGWVEKGLMPKAFEDALFAMQPNQVSAPVKTEFGYHVIRMGEIKAGQQVAFEDVREQLAREHAEADRERQFNEMAGRLVDLVYKNPTALEPAARELNLPVQTLGPFSRGADATGIAANPAVQRAAFSETLVQDGTVSDPIEIAPNHSVLIRVTQHTPERTLPLAEVREKVIAGIRADRSRKASEAAADAVLARVQKGETLEAIAATQGLQANSAQALQRGAPVPTPEANEAVFAVPRPAAGKVSPGKVALPDGSHLVFAVSKAEPGDPDSLPPAQREQMQNQMAQMKGVDAAQAYVSAMRKQMKVEVAEDRL